ncbi:UNVERIFIED_CONTAM: hypothetical protein FKN15_016799 [Acipenser sinensis]
MDRLASYGSDPFDKPSCKGCASTLKEPYIKCAECGPPPFLVCLQCFTRGFEYKTHQSDHKYEIMTSDFPVLDPSWTAQEEVGLLEAVMDCGFGNWWETTPPGPTFDSLLSRDMAGYMPARADFMEEFDNYAEWDLRDIDFVADDSDVLHLLERRYPKEVQDMYDAMRRFARVLGPTEHDKFIESHALEFELRREIARLQEYRRVGIQTFCSAKVYDRLKRSREEERKKRIMLSEVLQYIQDSNACQQWLHKQAAM